MNCRNILKWDIHRKEYLFITKGNDLPDILLRAKEVILLEPRFKGVVGDDYG